MSEDTEIKRRSLFSIKREMSLDSLVTVGGFAVALFCVWLKFHDKFRDHEAILTQHTAQIGELKDAAKIRDSDHVEIIRRVDKHDVLLETLAAKERRERKEQN